MKTNFDFHNEKQIYFNFIDIYCSCGKLLVHEWIIDRQIHVDDIKYVSHKKTMLNVDNDIKPININSYFGLILWHFIEASAIKRTSKLYRKDLAFTITTTAATTTVAVTVFVSHIANIEEVCWMFYEPITRVHSSYLHFSHFCLQHFLSKVFLLSRRHCCCCCCCC